ncbi:MAG: hypothetical protein M1133_14250, partial [Armatimonadetes bacterium]|nr:hypothetical protein [Armatimonadota bacterium]
MQISNYTIDAVKRGYPSATLAALILLASAGTAQSLAQFPMFRGDPQRTGRSQLEAGSDPKIAWTYKTGTTCSASPVVGEDGGVYFGAYDKYFYSITSGGSLAWQVRANSIISGTAAVDADGSICFGTLGGRVYSLASSGDPDWSSPYSIGSSGISGAMLIGNNGMVYYGADNSYVYA